MPTYTQEEILMAWKTFVAQGIILEDKVRPIIARAWIRCRKHGLDPWSSDFQKHSSTLLKEKKAQNAELLSVAAPIMQYAYTLLDCNVSICDAEGFLFELYTHIKNYPRSLGSYIKESINGNGAITLTLEEKVPARTDAYEHYRVISHSYSSVCAPLNDSNGKFVGAITGVSPFGPLIDTALPLIIAAAKLIEYLMANKSKRLKGIENNPYFMEMIDCSPDAVFILDSTGKILTANNVSEQLLGIKLNTLINTPFEKYLTDCSDILSRVGTGPKEKSQYNDCMFQGLPENLQEKVKRCRIAKNMIRLANGDIHTLLVFSYDHTSQRQVLNNKNLSSNRVNAGPFLPEIKEFIGQSPAWAKINEMIHKTAPYPSNVLLQGESGTGKEVVARAIHRLSKRKGSFVAINCGAIPRELLYSELFGYEGGAFTGAKANGSIGKFEHAHEGTLFLDEISEMPLDMQVALLRFLQERTVTRINSNKAKEVDVRIITATNKDMLELVRQGMFRLDLYYRLNVIEIKLPPLRERKSDIPLLANHFVAELSKQFNVVPRPVSEDVIHILSQYDWPGNVRELKNVMEKALVLSEGMEISPEDLPVHILHYQNEASQYEEQNDSEHSERDRIIRYLEQYDGNILKTAKALNMARNTLYRKIEKMNIKTKTSVVENK